MTEAEEHPLFKKYPKIFKKLRYLETSEGWNSILDMACSSIQWHIDSTRKQRATAIKYNRVLRRALNGDLRGLEHWYTYKGNLSEWGAKKVLSDINEAQFRVVPEYCKQVYAVQIKEKFGTLRFYYDGGDEYVSGVVTMAEGMSSCTCESCAKPGLRRSGGWVRTLCDDCNIDVEKSRHTD